MKIAVMGFADLKEFLNTKVELYNHSRFIESDPIQIPHAFQKKEDIEIAAFLVAVIAWGNRKMIIKNGWQLMEYLDYSPYDFVQQHQPSDLTKIESFVHRTFNGTDAITFVKALQHIYQYHGGLEKIFANYQQPTTLQPAISSFKKFFFEIEHFKRTEKHLSDPAQQSAAKRINMFLRWMVRNDNCGVDFGIWKSIQPSQLSCPLDVHSGNVARKLFLLTRKQNDAKALAELDKQLRILDPSDPVKYDFALFGLGVFEHF
jgi:uncharacterized protein (TIGR02757 family)